MAKLTVKLGEIRHCAKCGSSIHIVRHHMGHDAWIGRRVPHVAARYKDYLDCINLCNGPGRCCHMDIHYLYQLRIAKWNDLTTEKGLLLLRAELIKLCKEWLAGKRRTRVPPKQFQNFWEFTNAVWLNSRSK